MTCPRCQQDNPPHARFCLGCGARLALACGSCGAELPASARLCLQCGQAVVAGTAAPVRSPAPETYTPKHQQAQEHLATATTMYREMDMRFWLEQAEAESMELGA